MHKLSITKEIKKVNHLLYFSKVINKRFIENDPPQKKILLVRGALGVKFMKNFSGIKILYTKCIK